MNKRWPGDRSDAGCAGTRRPSARLPGPGTAGHARPAGGWIRAAMPAGLREAGFTQVIVTLQLARIPWKRGGKPLATVFSEFPG
jgi:hypothetical protein